MSMKNQTVVNCPNTANNKPLLDPKFQNLTPVPKVPVRGSNERRRIGKRERGNSNCAHVKNPWMLRIAGAFALALVIIVFAALHTKLNASLRNTTNELKRLHLVVVSLQDKVARLEISVRCGSARNGACVGKTTGSKGNQGEMRRPTKSRPTQIPNSPPKKRSRRKTVFVRWGKPHCSVYNRSQTTLIYAGRVASPHYTDRGGGSNYMCLPDKAFYTNPANISKVNRAFLYPVKYGPVRRAFQKYPDHILKIMTEEERKTHSSVPLDNKGVPCAMCQIDGATSTIMIPAHNICPPMWKKQYHGYLLSQKHDGEKTEFICVDIGAEGIPNTVSDKISSYLHLSEFRCESSSCRGGYKRNAALTCVVCAT